MKHDIVLHTCCAPCAGWCIEKLLSENKRVILFYSNDNLSDLAEFERRLEEHMEHRHFAVLDAIRSTGKLESDTEESLKTALNELLAEFHPAQ